jgi:hypothetical protein
VTKITLGHPPDFAKPTEPPAISKDSKMNVSTTSLRKTLLAGAFAMIASTSMALPIDAGSLAVPTIPAASLPFFSPATGAFTQVYYFNLLSNAGSLSANYNWSPDGSSGVAGTFYSSNNSGALLGPSLGSFTPDGSRNLNFSYGAITAGYYAFQFTGTSANAPTFSGQVSARVPAPAVIGLVGFGLLALGLARQARRA